MKRLDEAEIESDLIATIKSRRWPMPIITTSLRRALLSYQRLHTSRTREYPGAFAITWDNMRVIVDDLAEAEYLLRSWDDFHITTCEITRRLHQN